MIRHETRNSITKILVWQFLRVLLKIHHVIFFTITFLFFYRMELSVLISLHITVKCISIGTPKLINFQFVPNGKLIIFRYSKIWEHYSPIIMRINIGTLKNH